MKRMSRFAAVLLDAVPAFAGGSWRPAVDIHENADAYLIDAEIPGIDHPKVLGYADVLSGRKTAGGRVAIIGAGGIGFDVAEYLSHDPGRASPSLAPEVFAREWGIDLTLGRRGGVTEPEPSASPREIWLLQRKPTKPGRGLGRTTGWIHRLGLRARGVHMWPAVTYLRIDDAGLHIEVGGKPLTLQVDNVIVCAGQESNRALAGILQAQGRSPHLIGGAAQAKDEACAEPSRG